MAHWRMQLHPDAPGSATRYATESLASGFIGLDFKQDVGDLMRARREKLPSGQDDYWLFCHEMAIDDKVLIIVHHFPFALAIVDGEYNYIRNPVPQLGVWFRHFRAVRDVKYFADRETNASAWEQVRMTDTISRLVDTASKSYRLIETWR
jgi:hypothetical protein